MSFFIFTLNIFTPSEKKVAQIFYLIKCEKLFRKKESICNIKNFNILNHYMTFCPTPTSNYLCGMWHVMHCERFSI